MDQSSNIVFSNPAPLHLPFLFADGTSYTYLGQPISHVDRPRAVEDVVRRLPDFWHSVDRRRMRVLVLPGELEGSVYVVSTKTERTVRMDGHELRGTQKIRQV